MSFTSDFLYYIKEDYKVTKRIDCRLLLFIVRLRIFIFRSFKVPILRQVFRIIIDALYLLIVRLLFNCEISKQLVLGEGCGIYHPYNILIGDTTIGKNLHIGHEVTIGYSLKNGKMGLPVLGDNVFIGIGAKIIGPIVVGDNTRIGVNAVVYKDVPANAKVLSNMTIRLPEEVE